MPKETTFGQLKRGDRFALTRIAFRKGSAGDNIKVDPAMLCDPPFKENIPFNVICLTGGRVRTFRDEEKVLVLEGDAKR